MSNACPADAVRPALAAMLLLAGCADLLLLAGCATGHQAPVVVDRRDARPSGDSAVEDARAADSGPRDSSVADAGMDAGPIDSGVSCAVGEVGTCMTSCATRGTRPCVSGVFAECRPPEEDCNGVDDDCDGAIDEDVLPRACSSSCGGGMESCASGVWSGCSATAPQPEVCNGVDDDCDSMVDEDLTQPCSTACGGGTETCLGGTFAGCSAPRPAAEICNGIDDDCDSMVDEDLSRACATACGSGVETCNAGSYVGCSAPAPRAETCNSLDDDCDGSVDEGFQVEVFRLALATLTAEHPACTGSASSTSGCMAAASRYCSGHAWGCFRGGAGLLSVSGSSADVVCFGKDSTRLNTNITELSSVSGVPLVAADLSRRLAQSAVKRYCTNMGFAAGVGPIEHNGSGSVIALICLDAAHATVVGISTSEMRARGCDPITAPDLPACSYAADAWCRAAGHVAGLGPVEWNSSMTSIECLDDPS